MIKKIGKILLGISVLSMMNIDKVSASNEQLLSKSILGENNANVIDGEYNYSTDYSCTAPDYVNTYYSYCTSSYKAGLYAQVGNPLKSIEGKATYYYRGAVVNNYVNFAGQTWRIVRINEDGSIKLILENNISDNYVQWNPQNKADYVNAADGESDTIKDVVEDWYDTNIGNNNDIDNKVVTSAFCNDISGNYTTAKTRISSNNPSFACPTGANIVMEKVGLITGDELMYSGALIEGYVNNNPTYINNNKYFWSLTPIDSENVFWLYYSEGPFMAVTAGPVNNIGTASARPVINLDSRVMATGTGTKSDPYVISSKLYEEPKQEVVPTETYLNIKKDSNSAKEKIEKVVENNSIVYFEAEETNTFPGKANIDVSIKYGDGSKIWLYKYNKDTNKIEYVGNNINVIKGHAIVELSESGEYFFTANEIDSSLIGEQLGVNQILLVSLLSIILICGTAGFVYYNKLQKNKI